MKMAEGEGLLQKDKITEREAWQEGKNFLEEKYSETHVVCTGFIMGPVATENDGTLSTIYPVYFVEGLGHLFTTPDETVIKLELQRKTIICTGDNSEIEYKEIEADMEDNFSGHCFFSSGFANKHIDPNNQDSSRLNIGDLEMINLALEHRRALDLQYT